MIQIASVLAVATAFISVWTLLSRQRTGALYTRQKYLCRNLSQKCRGGAYTQGEGGVIAGFYSKYTCTIMIAYKIISLTCCSKL